MAKLFVSYSRKDSIAARKLIEAFKTTIQQDVWVDWESIPPAVDWLEQIFRGIEEADAFIFMISPDSIASEVCKVEIGRAVLNNKRIIPIVLRDVKPQDCPESISKLNWTFIRESDNFEEGLAKIKTAIELDLDWLEEHRRLQVRALDWHRKKDVSLLLRGRDLRNARNMVQTYTSKDPIPTELQLKYIDHSRIAERNRFLAWVATGIAVIALTILAITALQQSIIAQTNEHEAKRQAVIAENNSIAAIINQGKALVAQKEAERERERALEQEKLAKAQRSAARAQIYQTRTGELYTSTLFALDSLAESPSAPSEEAQEILRQNISLLPLPLLQTKQDGSIIALELHPNEKDFLSVSSESVCVRGLEDGKELFCEPSSSSVNEAIFTRNGKSIAMAEEDGTVRLLNAETGSIERTIAMGSPVRDLDVDSRGNMLTIACANGNITIIDLAKANDKGYSLKMLGTLTTADLSADGRWFAAGSESGQVTIWNINSNQVITSGSHRGEVLSIRFSSDNRFVTSGGIDNYAVGFDIQTNKEAFRLIHADWVEDISVPSNNSWITTASDDERVRIWDLFTGKERLVMFQNGPVTEVRISPDEKWIAGTGEDTTVRVWSAYTGVEMLQIPLEASGTALTFSNDSQHLLTGDDGGNIRIWDISRLNAPTKYIQFNDLTWISKFNPASNTLIAASANRVWSLDPKTLSTPSSVAPGNFTEFKGDIYDLVINPNGQSIGFSTYQNEYIIYDLKTFISRRVEPSSDAYALTFSNDGSSFITGAQDGAVEIWDAATGKLIRSKNVGSAILSLAAGSNEIAVGISNKILILDSNAESTPVELNAPGENQFIAFNKDDSLLASVNTTGQIVLWKKENGTYTLQSMLTREQPYSLAFDPQSNLLAVGTTNKVYLIDADKSVEIARIPHKGIVYDLFISTDGKTLATASLKTIQLWDVAALQSSGVTDLHEAACSRLLSNFGRSEWNVLFGSDEEYKQLCENLPTPE